MRKGWKKIHLILLLLLLVAVPVQRTDAATQYPRRIKLNKTKVTAVPGESLRLKVTATPKKLKNFTVLWTSSNENVATVTAKGRVKVNGIGTARITAVTENGKKASCTVKGVQYISENGKTRIGTPDGVKTYREYKQGNYGLYYRSFGCVTTAVAITASGYGKSYTPGDIHAGASNKKYSERYALKKMKASTSLYNQSAISVRTASNILKNMGIENKAVYKFTVKKAYRQIKEHLLEGKPVIIKANNRTHNGIRLAVQHHALVLIGLDEKERIIYLEPGNRQKCNIKLKTLITYHMTPASGNYKTPHVSSIAAAGGYILVG